MLTRRFPVLWFFVLCFCWVGCAAVEQADQEIPTRFPPAGRIVAIGDLHGDMDATRSALLLAGAIDDQDRWAGGKLVLVQTGDQLDRGGDEQEILELFTRLAEEAKNAGGAVHVLNGNHELMNASLDLRYITDEGFRDFEDAVTFDESDSLIASYPPERRARVAAFRPGGPYAMVLARRNTIAIIGDNLFVHGGLLPEHVDYGVERMNAEIRAFLRDEIPRPEWSFGSNSPVWARHFSDGVDREESAMLADVLDRLGVKRIIVGHTVQEGGIASFCDGRVWCIDVGMSAHYGGVVKVLEITGDTVKALR